MFPAPRAGPSCSWFRQYLNVPAQIWFRKEERRLSVLCRPLQGILLERLRPEVATDCLAWPKLSSQHPKVFRARLSSRSFEPCQRSTRSADGDDFREGRESPQGHVAMSESAGALFRVWRPHIVLPASGRTADGLRDARRPVLGVRVRAQLVRDRDQLRIAFVRGLARERFVQVAP